MSDPLGYFLTWTTYGTWLPGDARGWVDRRRRHGIVVEEASDPLAAHARGLLKEPAVTLDERMRAAVEAAILERCREGRWGAHALSVQSNHVHVVVAALGVPPGKVMGVLKAAATRALNALGGVKLRDHWWTGRGSKRILATQKSLVAAMEYVCGQSASWKKQG